MGRRAQAFRVRRHWHFAFQQVAADPEFGVDLRRARVEGRQVVLPRSGVEDIRVPLDAEGCFDLADFAGDKLPPGVAMGACKNCVRFSDTGKLHVNRIGQGLRSCMSEAGQKGHRSTSPECL